MSNKPKIENIKVNIVPHASGKDYCVMTLHAEFDGVPYSESLSVFSGYFFSNEVDDDYRTQLFNDVLTKLSSDLLNKYYGLSSHVNKTVDSSEILNQMRKLYEQ